MIKLLASPYLLLTLTPLFWSCNWIIGRALHDDMPPMALTFFRWLLASLVLAPFVVSRLARDWPTIRAHWRTMALLGTVGIALHNAIAYIGLNYTTATNGVVLNSFIPVMIIAMAWAFFGERLTRVQLLGVAVSLVGVLAILSGGSLATLARFRLNAGDLCVILAMGMWSLYTVLLRRRPLGLDRLSFLFVLAIVGVVIMLPLWLGESMLIRSPVWSVRAFAALIGGDFLVGARVHILESRRRAPRARSRGPVRAPDAGVRRAAGVAVPGRAAGVLPLGRNGADPHGNRGDEPRRTPRSAGGHRLIPVSEVQPIRRCQR